MMERVEIIKARSFADKFNELTSFIYDNFGVLWKWALAFVTPCAMLMAALIKYLPDQTSINILKMSLSVLLISVLSISLNTLTKHYFEEGIELKRLTVRKYMAEIIKNIGVGIIASFMFNLLVSCIAFSILGLLNVEGTGLMFTFVLYSIIVSFFSLPIFYSADAVIIEDKSAGSAIGRALALILYRPFKAIIFLFTMTLIGLILPSIATIPYMIIENVKKIFSNGGFFFTSETIPLWEYASLTISFFCFILTVLAMGIGMMLEYGNAVENADNVSFMKKYNNFENL